MDQDMKWKPSIENFMLHLLNNKPNCSVNTFKMSVGNKKIYIITVKITNWMGMPFLKKQMFSFGFYHPLVSLLQNLYIKYKCNLF